MKATNIRWDTDTPEEVEGLPEEILIPDKIAAGIHHIDEIQPNYNSLIGYETGVPKQWWYGIENITFIFMGPWSDSYIGYKNYAINSHYVEDAMWDRYNEEYPAAEPSKEGFSEYMRSNKDDVFELLDTIIIDLEERISDYISENTGFCHVGFTIEA